MKPWGFLALAVLACSGCGSGKTSDGLSTEHPSGIGSSQTPGTKDVPPALQKTAKESAEYEKTGATWNSEEDLGVPYYPGGIKIAYSNMKAVMEGSQTASLSFATEDTPDKVATFYKSEGAKRGKLIDLGPIGSEKVQIIAIDLKDGRRCQIQAMQSQSFTSIMITAVTPKKK